MVVEPSAKIAARMHGVLVHDYQIVSLLGFHDFESEVDRYDPNIILIDTDHDPEEGLQCIARLRSRDTVSNSYCGIIMTVSDGSSPYIAMGAGAGADCFCMKPFIEAQLPAVVQAVARLRIMTEKLQAYSDSLLMSNLLLENLATTDELTGLFNMRFVKKRLAEEFETAKKQKSDLAVLMIDIDHFKQVNDGADHLLGSYVIGEVGREIYRVTRRADIPGRYGGDEFIIVLPFTGESGARSVAERLHERIMSRVYDNGVDTTTITISQGIGLLKHGDESLETFEDLVRRADHALYQAKENGRNMICVYGDETRKGRDEAS